MSTFQRIPMPVLAIAVSSVAGIGWVALEGTAPLVIGMVAASIIAMRSVVGDAKDPEQA